MRWRSKQGLVWTQGRGTDSPRPAPPWRTDRKRYRSTGDCRPGESSPRNRTSPAGPDNKSVKQGQRTWTQTSEQGQNQNLVFTVMLFRAGINKIAFVMDKVVCGSLVSRCWTSFRLVVLLVFLPTTQLWCWFWVVSLYCTRCVSCMFMLSSEIELGVFAPPTQITVNSDYVWWD